MKEVHVTIEGATPLLLHRFSDEAQMAATSGARSSIANDSDAPAEQAEQALYTDENGASGIPQLGHLPPSRRPLEEFSEMGRFLRRCRRTVFLRPRSSAPVHRPTCTGKGRTPGDRSHARCSYTARGSQPVSAKMAQSGIGAISPCAAISAMVVDWTPAPSEITHRIGCGWVIVPPSRRSRPRPGGRDGRCRCAGSTAGNRGGNQAPRVTSWLPPWLPPRLWSKPLN